MSINATKTVNKSVNTKSILSLPLSIDVHIVSSPLLVIQII